MTSQVESAESEPSRSLKVISYIAIGVAAVVIGFFLNLIVSANRAFENHADPDNRRLEALGADPADGLKPPGSRLLRRTRTVAQVNSKSRSRTGPRIYLEYSIPEQGGDPEEFYRRRLKELGWRHEGASQYLYERGPAVTFQKEIDDWNATLSLGKEDTIVWVELEAPPVEE